MYLMDQFTFLFFFQLAILVQSRQWSMLVNGFQRFSINSVNNNSCQLNRFWWYLQISIHWHVGNTLWKYLKHSFIELGHGEMTSNIFGQSKVKGSFSINSNLVTCFQGRYFSSILLCFLRIFRSLWAVPPNLTRLLLKLKWFNQKYGAPGYSPEYPELKIQHCICVGTEMIGNELTVIFFNVYVSMTKILPKSQAKSNERINQKGLLDRVDNLDQKF